MSNITVVTGGARSGKSTYGESILKEVNGRKGYIATSVPFDTGMKDRIKKHKESRPSDWETFEYPYNIGDNIEWISKRCDIVILDCITVYMSNIMFKDNKDYEKISYKEIDLLEERIINEIKKVISKARENNLDMVIITNEVGSGIVPGNRLSRIYRDIAGRINQLLSSLSDNVYVCISGLPLKLK